MNTCPKCGAKALPATEWDGPMERTSFRCNSQKLSDYFYESHQCLRNQLSAMTAERDRLQARKVMSDET